MYLFKQYFKSNIVRQLTNEINIFDSVANYSNKNVEYLFLSKGKSERDKRINEKGVGCHKKGYLYSVQSK